MASHDSPRELVADTIKEYLSAARICLDHRKVDQGCLGGPAALLLFSVVDAMGEFSGLDRGKTLNILTQAPFGLTLTDNQVEYIKFVVRHGLVHEASIRDYARLVERVEPPIFVFQDSGDPALEIALGALYETTARAWLEFDKKLIDSHEGGYEAAGDKARTKLLE
jgi:hypothetical protein